MNDLLSIMAQRRWEYAVTSWQIMLSTWALPGFFFLIVFAKTDPSCLYLNEIASPLIALYKTEDTFPIILYALTRYLCPQSLNKGKVAEHLFACGISNDLSLVQTSSYHLTCKLRLEHSNNYLPSFAPRTLPPGYCPLKRTQTCLVIALFITSVGFAR